MRVIVGCGVAQRCEIVWVVVGESMCVAQLSRDRA
jgi:hypothetical protein